MKTTEVVSGRAFTDLQLGQLVEQMDSSIGEATSVMGAMVQEIIRRSLRGGVLQEEREQEQTREPASRQGAAKHAVL